MWQQQQKTDTKKTENEQTNKHTKPRKKGNKTATNKGVKQTKYETNKQANKLNANHTTRLSYFYMSECTHVPDVLVFVFLVGGCFKQQIKIHFFAVLIVIFSCRCC